MQLQTGHITLHMYKISIAGSPTCPACGKVNKSVYHFPFYYLKYKEQRNKLRAKWRGASCIRTLLTKPKTMTPLFKHIHDKQKFTRTIDDPTISKEKGKRIGKEERHAQHKDTSIPAHRHSHSAQAETDTKRQITYNIVDGNNVLFILHRAQL